MKITVISVYSSWNNGAREIEFWGPDPKIVDMPAAWTPTSELVTFVQVTGITHAPSQVGIMSCNSIGCSVNAVTASTTIPDPPTAVLVRVFDENTLNISITRPLNDGGANITHYKVVPFMAANRSITAHWRLDTIDKHGAVKEILSGAWINSAVSATYPALNGAGNGLAFNRAQTTR